MDKSIFFPSICWLILLFIILRKKHVSFVWMFISLVFFMLYQYMWRQDIYAFFRSLVQHKSNFWIQCFHSSLQMGIYSSFWLWPLSLIIVLIVKDKREKSMVISATILFNLIFLLGLIGFNLYLQ